VQLATDIFTQGGCGAVRLCSPAEPEPLRLHFGCILHLKTYAPPLLQVTVVESHSVPGGAAHTWERGGYHFESGPSLYSGMNGGHPSSSSSSSSSTHDSCYCAGAAGAESCVAGSLLAAIAVLMV
jgi:hypothetical protein